MLDTNMEVPGLGHVGCRRHPKGRGGQQALALTTLVAAGRVPAVSVAWRRAHISRPMFIETAHTFRAKGICASVSASFQRSESTCVTREFRLLSPRWKLTPTSAPALGTTAASLS